jgi:small redox-active disulfide protein 2
MTLFGKRKETNKPACGCGCGCGSGAVKAGEPGAAILVLGGGCAKCHDLLNNTQAALKEMGSADEAELVTDYAKIAAYGVMSTPALVADGKVLSYGKVLKKDEIIALLSKR